MAEKRTCGLIAVAAALLSSMAGAQPGTELFADDLNGNLNDFTIATSGGDASLGTETRRQGQSLRLRWGPVSIATTGFAADVPGADLSLWIRRGDSSFSDPPEAGEDLVIEYRDAGGNWNVIATHPGDGTPGEILTPTYSLPVPALHANLSIRLRLSGGSGVDEDYWHIDDLAIVESGGTPLLFSFEELVWTGAAGEVEDTNGSGIGGTVAGGAINPFLFPAIATNPGTCRYADLDGSDDSIVVPDNDALDMSTSLSVSAWINARSLSGSGQTILSKSGNYEVSLDAAGRIVWRWTDSGGAAQALTTSQSVATGRWYHLLITYDGRRQVIYVDGVPWASQRYLDGLARNDQPLVIGAGNTAESPFDGFIDEVYITREAMSLQEARDVRDAMHECTLAAAQFTINHDTQGIHCLPEVITIDVVDTVTGTPLIGYNAQVTIDTQSGFGSWALVAGSGALTDAVANDGVATYDWPLGESQVQLELYYPEGNPVLDIDAVQVSDPGIRDTDAEGALVFSPSGFTVTAVPVANPPGVIVPFASAQTAAVPFDVYITAYGTTPSDPACGVIESYTNDRNLRFWSEYVNPGTGTLPVTVDGAAAAATEATAVDQVVSFTAGQGQVTVRYKDAGAIRLAMKDVAAADPGLPAGIQGATAAFVSRPADFTLSSIADASGAVPNPAAVDASGPVFIAAGAPFRATVTALDADGDPTPNFGRETPAASVELETLLVAPAAGANPAVSAPTGFVGFAGGTATGNDFSWPEVGIVQLRPSVFGGDYLGSGDVVGTDSGTVGRFIPDHFDVARNTPVLQTQCTAGPVFFTYAGQPFGYSTAPLLTATARAVGGTTTLNYTGSFFRMTTATLDNIAYTAAAGTLDLSGVPTSPGDPTVTDIGAGIAEIRFDASGSTQLAFLKATPEAPFDADIALSVDVLDADGVAGASNPVVFGGAGGIAFTAEPLGREIRHGRLRFVNAAGSELVDLPVPLFSEYFAGPATGFIANGDDACTTGVSISLSGYTEQLNPGETCVLDAGAPGLSGAGCTVAAPLALRFTAPPVGGDFGLRLAAPGVGNTGSVRVDAVVPTWLRFDWDAATAGDENPSGIATFGVFGGHGSQIYLRELY